MKVAVVKSKEVRYRLAVQQARSEALRCTAACMFLQQVGLFHELLSLLTALHLLDG